MALETFNFGEKDPKKIDEFLGLNSSGDEGISYDEDDDLDEEDFDEDCDEDGEDEDDVPAYKSVVQLTPPSPRTSGTTTGTSTFGQNPSNEPIKPLGGIWNTKPTTTPSYSSGSSYGFGSTSQGSTWNSRPLTGWGNVGGSVGQNSLYGNGYGGYGNNNYGNYQRKNLNLPRNCKILFCELLDVILEPKYFSPNEMYGLDPRGAYDLYPKHAVWDVIRQMRPEYVFIITNQPGIEPGTKAALRYQSRVDSVLLELSDFLKLPEERCRCFSKLGTMRDCYTKPNTGLMTVALRTIPGVNELFERSEIYMIGAQSGYPGESDVDRKTAEAFGITYIPVRDLV